jgi:predicted Fe-Mo cluster-binding NifX family protein
MRQQRELVKKQGGNTMKICISSTGKSSKDSMDELFGRCKYFAIYDTETKEYNFIDNAGLQAEQGAGIKAAQLIVEQNVSVMISGRVGPNAVEVLAAAGIEIYGGKIESIEACIVSWEKGELSKMVG